MAEPLSQNPPDSRALSHASMVKELRKIGMKPVLRETVSAETPHEDHVILSTQRRGR